MHVRDVGAQVNMELKQQLQLLVSDFDLDRLWPAGLKYLIKNVAGQGRFSPLRTRISRSKSALLHESI